MSAADRLIPAIAARRSIRSFTADPVERGALKLILEAGRLAPSAVNLQHLRVIVADTPAALARVRSAAYGIGAVAAAPLVLICLADLDAGALISERIRELTEARALEPADTGAIVSGAGRPFELRIGEDVAVMDAAIGVAHMELQAVELGLGTCWVHHADYRQITDDFGIGGNLRVVTLLAVGHPAESPAPRPRIVSIEIPTDL